MKIRLEHLEVIGNVRDIDRAYVAELVEAGVEHARNWPAIKVRVVTDAVFVVIDGAHRVVAADELGIEELECELVEADTRLAELELGIAANIAHGKPFTRDEKIHLCKRLSSEFSLSLRQMAKIFRCHHSTIQNWLDSVDFATAKKPELTEEEVRKNLANNFIKSCLKITEEFDNYADFNSVVDDLVHDDGQKFNAIQQIVKSLSAWVEV